MKKISLFIISIILMIPILVKASGSVTVDKTSISVSEGGSTTFVVTSTNAAARVTISSDNTNVATVNKSDEWVENESLTVTVNGVHEGTAKITVNIDAATFDEEEIVKTETINVIVGRDLSTNANLSDIKIDDVSLTGFSSNATVYNLTIDKESVSIAAVVEEEHATVTGVGPHTLNFGLNAIPLVVTAESGAKKTYTLNITRTDYRDSNNYLESLSITPGSISFNKNTLEYETTVDMDVTSVNITATAESSKATVTGDGTKNLTGASTVLSIVVTAENGSKKTYNITVTKADGRDSNNYLKSLTVSEGTLVFNKNTLEYVVRVSESVTSINITAEAESSKATVTGDGTKTLNSETNVFDIVVMAENESVRTYKVTVVRSSDVVLTYNSNKGSICSPTYKSVAVNQEWGELCTPNRQGYQFNGWFTEESGGTEITATTVATADITVFAHWTSSVVNPNTGLKTPIAILVCLIVASIVVLLIIRKRNMAF